MAAQKAFDTFQICVGNAVRAPQLMKRGRAAISCSCKACAFASMSATGNSARMTATAASFTLRALTLCALTLCSLLERDSSRSRCLQVVPPSYEIRFNVSSRDADAFVQRDCGQARAFVASRLREMRLGFAHFRDAGVHCLFGVRKSAGDARCLFQRRTVLGYSGVQCCARVVVG